MRGRTTQIAQILLMSNPPLHFRRLSSRDQMTSYAPSATRRFAARHAELGPAQSFAVASGI